MIPLPVRIPPRAAARLLVLAGLSATAPLPAGGSPAGGDWRDVFAGLPRDDGTEPSFLAVECQVDRGNGWSRSTTVYLARGTGAIVALDR